MAGIVVRHLKDTFIYVKRYGGESFGSELSIRFSTLMNTQHKSIYVELHINRRVRIPTKPI